MRIPAFNEFDGCPKCRLPTDETTGGLLASVAFHSAPVEGESCHDLLITMTVEQQEELEIGEHLCRSCARCGYGWVEQVVRPESPYADNDGHCGCDHHGDHGGCDASCRERGCVR